MHYLFPVEIEQLVAAQLATGRYTSENEVLLHALRHLNDYSQSITDVEAGIADEAAGRVRRFSEVDADIRQQLEFDK